MHKGRAWGVFLDINLEIKDNVICKLMIQIVNNLFTGNAKLVQIDTILIDNGNVFKSQTFANLLIKTMDYAQHVILDTFFRNSMKVIAF